MRDDIVDFQSSDQISLKPLRESMNRKLNPMRPALQDEFAFELVDAFSKQAGELMFKSEFLSIDLDGNGVAEMKINLPGVLCLMQKISFYK